MEGTINIIPPFYVICQHILISLARIVFAGKNAKIQIKNFIRNQD